MPWYVVGWLFLRVTFEVILQQPSMIWKMFLSHRGSNLGPFERELSSLPYTRALSCFHSQGFVIYNLNDTKFTLLSNNENTR